MYAMIMAMIMDLAGRECKKNLLKLLSMQKSEFIILRKSVNKIHIDKFSNVFVSSVEI